MDTCLDSLKTLERENGENRCGLGGIRTLSRALCYMID